MYINCLFRFSQCVQTRLHHLTANDHDELIHIIYTARNAFFMTAGGMNQFNDLLQMVRRHKMCKNDLFKKIMNSLHSTGSGM